MRRMTPAPYDRRRLRARSLRLAAQPCADPFLRRAIEASLVERIGMVRRDFKRVLVLGRQDGALAEALAGLPGVKEVVALDVVPGRGPLAVVGDEEILPFRDGAFDAIVSALSLHWVNDLVGLLVQARRCLVPDGLLLAGFPGGDSLKELRYALTQAELEIRGGMEPRVMPMIDVRDAGGLLQRAGFALPVADVERLPVRYGSPLGLFADLRAMGETNHLRGSGRTALRRDVFARAVAIYAKDFSDPDGRVRAAFDLVYLTAWAPAPSQPKPLRPGSGQVSMAKAVAEWPQKGAKRVSD